jgi:serine/threonine-protein kinase
MMEFLEGEPLDAYIKRVGALSAAVALGIADQVLNGLAEAHKKGVVHRDLKPSNVFLLREHNGELLVKVIDFGLARQEPIALVDAAVALLPRTNDGASLLAGTPEYIAPEQAQGLKVDGGADLYSLGVMLFEMLSGQLPFESPNVSQLLQKHLSERPPHLSSVVNNLVEGLEEFVESLLEKDPGSRPSSADAARVTVQRLLKRLSADSTAVRQLPVEPKHLPTVKLERPTTPAQSSTERELGAAFPKRRRSGVGVAVVVLLAAALLEWWLWSRDAAPVKVVEPAPVVVTQPVAVVPATVATPSAVAEPVAEAQPPPPVAPAEEDLAPMPQLKPGAPGVAVVTPKKPKVDTKFVIEAAGCVPDAEWRKRVRDELSALNGWAAQNRQSEKFEQLERGTAGYMQASGPGDCVRVMTALHGIRAAFGLPDE